MNNMTLRLAWMYPDCLNLHGERGSVQAFQRVGENLGIEVQVKRINDFDEPIVFDEFDLLLFLPGELTTFNFLRPALERQRSALQGYLDRGGWLLAVGTTGLLFGGKTLREDGSVFEGLGLLDITGKERTYVWGDDLHFRLRDTKQEIFGSQIQMVDVEAREPLGDVLYGRGNNAVGTEGARYKNLIFTNCLGPVFAKNPWWTEDIIKNIVLQKLGISQAKPYEWETASFASCLRFTRGKPEFPIK